MIKNMTFCIFSIVPWNLLVFLLAFCFLTVRNLVSELCSKNKKTAAEWLRYDSFQFHHIICYLQFAKYREGEILPFLEAIKG